MDRARSIELFIAIVVFTVVAGCDQDPFHLRERQVLSGYELQQWEDSNTYYLVRDSDRADTGGVLDGTVVRIGWNKRYIIAERKANFGGDKDGWMVIDTEAQRVSGPFNDVEIKARTDLQSIATMPASEAWKRLR
jgi:hypothetical protein